MSEKKNERALNQIDCRVCHKPIFPAEARLCTCAPTGGGDDEKDDKKAGMDDAPTKSVQAAATEPDPSVVLELLLKMNGNSNKKGLGIFSIQCDPKQLTKSQQNALKQLIADPKLYADFMQQLASKNIVLTKAERDELDKFKMPSKKDEEDLREHKTPFSTKLKPKGWK